MTDPMKDSMEKDFTNFFNKSKKDLTTDKRDEVENKRKIEEIGIAERINSEQSNKLEAQFSRLIKEESSKSIKAKDDKEKTTAAEREKDAKKTKTGSPNVFKKTSTAVRKDYHAHTDKEALADENLKLKINQNKLEQHIKDLNMKFRMVEDEYKYARKRYEGDDSVAKELEFINDLKEENQALKEQLKDSRHPKPIIPGKQQKVIVKTSNNGHQANENIQMQQRLIDALKKQIGSLEKENKDLQTKMISQNKNHIQASQFHGSQVNVSSSGIDYQKQAFEKLTKTKDMYEKTIADLNSQLYEEKRKNTNLEIELNNEKFKSMDAESMRKALDDAKMEKITLEARIKSLSMSPFMSNKDSVSAHDHQATVLELKEIARKFEEARERNVKLEHELAEAKKSLKIAVDEREKIRDEKIKLEAVAMDREQNRKFFDDQLKLLKIDNDRDKDNFLKALGTVRLQGEEPGWRKFEFIDRYQEVDYNNPAQVLKELNKIKEEKKDLAAQLEKCQVLLQNQQEIEQAKDAKSNAMIQKLELQLKAANSRIQELVQLADFRAMNYREMAGKATNIPDDIPDDFSEITESELGAGENTFDILVGECRFEELMIRKVLGGKVPDLHGLQTLVAVDFYDHDTQNSGFCEGLTPQYSFQVAFKVEINEALISFFENDTVKVEIYATIGSDLVFLGNCNVPLNEVLLKNYNPSIGNTTVSTPVAVRNGENTIGVLTVKLRMRHQFSEAIRWVKEREQYIRDVADTVEQLEDVANTTRKLVVNVSKASGLPPKSVSFAFYKFFTLRDVTTPTVAGSDPGYNHITTLDVPQNAAIRNYMKKEVLEIVIFDDSVPLKPQGDDKVGGMNDIIGRVRIHLEELLNDNQIDQSLPIINLRGTKVGTLSFRIYWYDNLTGTTKKPEDSNSNLTKLWEEDFTRRIANLFTSKGQTLETAFRMISVSDPSCITREEFRWGILMTFKMKVPEDEISTYWTRLKLVNNRLTKEEFYAKFSKYMSEESNMEITKTKLKELNNKQGISQINRMLNKNTEDLMGALGSESIETFAKQLAEYVRNNNATVDEVLAKFRRDNDSYITKLEIKSAMEKLGLLLSFDQKEEIVKYFDHDGNNRISFDYFSKVMKDATNKEFTSKLQTETGSIPFETRKDIIHNIAAFLIDLARNQGTTMVDIANRIKGRQAIISKNDISKFCAANNSKITEKELNVFYSELDPEVKKAVTVDQFLNVLRRYYNERPTITPQVEEALKEIARYIKRFDKDLYSYFKAIDVDGDGFLDRNELQRAIVATKAIASDITIQNVMNHFDYTRDNRISLDEFIKTIEPYLTKTTITRQNTMGLNPMLKNLKRNIAEIVNKNYKNLVDMFEIYKERPGLCTTDKFKKVFIDTKYLTMTEVEGVLENFVEYEKDLVKYQTWLDEMKEYHSQEALTESQALSTSHGDLKRSISAENVFKSLANSIKNTKSKPSDVFKIFDVDGDGVITHSEFRTAFQKMDLKFTYDEVSQIIRQIDVTNDGKINYGEFIKALKLN